MVIIIIIIITKVLFVLLFVFDEFFRLFLILFLWPYKCELTVKPLQLPCVLETCRESLVLLEVYVNERLFFVRVLSVCVCVCACVCGRVIERGSMRGPQT